MWHLIWRLRLFQAEIQNDPSHGYFSLRSDKPKPKQKVELATSENTARLLLFNMTYWTERAQMEDRKGKTDPHTLPSPCTQATSLLATTLWVSYKKPLNMSFQKTETIMLKRRIWQRTATYMQKVFKSPKRQKCLSQVQWYNYEQ